MRLVLDTNVVVSAFINPKGTPSQIIKFILQGKAQLVYNTQILEEYIIVMARPKFSGKIDPNLIHRFIELIKNTGFLFDPLPGKNKLPDEKDRIFYDTAKNSGSILISGNIKHYPKEAFILPPGDFIKRLS